MNADLDTRQLIGDTVHALRSFGKELALTDLVFKIIAFIVLTPLVGVLFRVLLAWSGSAVLSDVDILFFFLGPVGWVCFIVVGSLSIGIIALEQASLMAILYAGTVGQRPGIWGALRFAYVRAWPVIQLTTRVIVSTLLAATPFLAVAALVYFNLLTTYDINYYLQERPPVFLVALGVGAIILVTLLALLLRLFTGWFFALPLVLFAGFSAMRALSQSRESACGRRRPLLVWIVGWMLATGVMSALVTGLVGLLARLLIPWASNSLHLLAAASGASMLLLALAGLGVNLLSATTFAAILFNGFRQLDLQGAADTALREIAEQTGAGISLQFTRKRLIAAAAVGAVASFTIGTVSLHSVRLDDDVMIMAHRGSSLAAPENTLAAVRQAIQDRADWVEIDVQETADGEVVLFHDSDFMKLAGRDLKIWDATLDDLKEIDIGSWFAPEFKDERVPTLAEVLDECKGKIGVNIELKYYGHDEQLEQRVADIVQSRGMTSDVMAMSLKVEGVLKMKEIRPDWQVGLLMSVYAGRMEQIAADFLAVNANFADQRLIRTAHKNGKQVYVWTVNDAATMSTMIGRGVDGLLTDKPALARSVLEQRAEMSAPERLLLELGGMLGVPPELGEP